MGKLGLNFLLKKLKINKNAYLNYIKNIEKNRQKAMQKCKILDKIKKIYHENNGTPGYRMICDELRNLGIKISYPTVYKYMKILGLKSIIMQNMYT